MRILDNLILYHYTALRKYRTNNHIDMGIFYEAAVNGVNYSEQHYSIDMN